MSKTIKNVFYEKLTFVKLLEAHYRAALGKHEHQNVIRFEMDLESNITNLFFKIKNKQYSSGNYHSFYVYEPKKRLIKSLPYVDRVVHQWYVEEFIKPHFLPRFIFSSYACLKDKGVHEAVLRTQKYMRYMKRKYGSYYILKCDIHKYFYSIDKNILFQTLKRNMKDKELIAFTKVLIFDDNEENGIPIGNYTSQYFANIYLNELDHYVKETLKVKCYLRYIDDFILMVPTKQEAIEYKKKIEVFLKEKLQLSLNKKSGYYPSKMGIDFCGYRIFETHRLLRKRSKTKIKKNIKKWNRIYSLGTLDVKHIIKRWNSWYGHAMHANTHNLITKYWYKIDFNQFLKK